MSPILNDPDKRDDPIPPSAIRIARRALALAAIAARAAIEQVGPDETPTERERQHKSIITWATKVTAIDELEPEEKEILQSPIGSLSERTRVNSSWRTELEILSYHNQLWSLHWRLRDYSVSSEIMDFKKVGKEVWFGPLDTSMFKMIDGDLAISGQRIDKAPKEIFSQAISLARERHHAATWLLGDNPIYSEIDTST